MSFLRHCFVLKNQLCCYRVIKMNIATFIQNHKELSELPFLIVFRTMQILNNMGVLKFPKESSDVEAEK